MEAGSARVRSGGAVSRVVRRRRLATPSGWAERRPSRRRAEQAPPALPWLGHPLRKAAQLGPSVEDDLAVGVTGHLVVGVVGSGVVSGAEQSALVEVGRATVGPAGPVVGVTHPGWPVTTLGHAAAVPQGHGGGLGLGVEPSGSAEVEDLGVSAEDDGDDPGGARQASCRGSGDVFAGVEDPGLLQASGRVSRSMVTTIVASLRPTLGRSLALMRSMSSMNALPIRSGPGRRSTPGPSVAARCLGAARARSIFFSSAAWSVGRVNRPWTFPWPSSVIVSRAAWAALASSFSRRSDS